MTYKVRFDTGQTVDFQNKPTDADIEEVVKRLGIKPKKAETPQEKEGQLATTGRELKEVGAGVLRGLGSTFTGLGQLTLKGASFIPPLKKIAERGIQTGEEIKKEFLTPETPAEKVGFVGEQIGEFLIPVGAQAKALSFLRKAIPTLSKSTRLSGGLTRLLTKATASGAEFGGKTILQSGGDFNQAADSAFIGFLTPPVFGAIGKVGKFATKVVPEKLYSQIFKTATDDLLKYYRTVAKGQKINPTLAKEALDKGLKGSSKNMAVYSIKKLGELEQKVQETVKAKQLGGVKINIGNKKGYENILDTVRKQFKSGFLSERTKEADRLTKTLRATKEKEIGINDVLNLRRFIDRMRNTSSFRIDPKLTPRQEEFKFAADTLRSKLSKAGLKDLMNEERVFIEAIENIVKDAALRKNKQLLNLTDVLIGGGGMASGFPGTGIGLAVLVRGFQQPYTLTNLGQILFKSGNAIESIVPFLKLTPKALPPLMREK